MQKKEQVAILGVSFSKNQLDESEANKGEKISWDDGKLRKDRQEKKTAYLTTVLSQKVRLASI